jgi:hypothetical protein
VKFEDTTQVQGATVSETGFGVLWVTDPQVAVTVIVYTPGGVPGLPFPPPPCSPPPHDTNRSTSSKVAALFMIRADLGAV